MYKIQTLSCVPASHLCCGCGICAHLHPDKIKMVDIPSSGRRPSFIHGANMTDDFAQALKVCPGIQLSHFPDTFKQKDLIHSLIRSWGPIFEIWEGHAADPELRYKGSSGGAMSALALYCLEQEDMAGVLHVTADPQKPYLNKSILSTGKKSIVAAIGSRYSPASPCENLQEIDNANGPCVFMGKPCDVAAVSKLKKIAPEWGEKVGLTIACFCAGTPSTNGTLEMLNKMGIKNPDQLSGLRYRGHGWPGKTRAEQNEETVRKKVFELDYSDSWGGILQKHRQWRCYICPDHTGEFADISVGDPWYKEVTGDTSGRSLVLVRSQRGKELLRKAIEQGYIVAEKREAEVLPASQFNLEKARARLWGQLTALKMLNAPYPIFKGFSLYHTWQNNLNFSEKVRSILGTMKRVFLKDLKNEAKIC